MRAVCAYINYIPMGILVLQCFGLYEFTRFRNAKTKRVRRLFQYVLYLTLPKDIFPRRGQIRQNFCFALQNYTKKMTYARAHAIFLRFYSKFVILSPFLRQPVSVLRFNPKSLLCIVFLVSVISRSSAGGC